MSNNYLYLDGIRKLAKNMRGDERIHVGIRPYEFHAGNKLAIIVYPIILCQELEKLGKTPKINILLSLNDWEQRVLSGSNIYKYIFDIKPLDTTIQYANESDGKTSTAKYWSDKIVQAMKEITKRYKDVRITPIFNSELKETDPMKTVVLRTLQDGKFIKDLMLKATDKETNNSSKKFCAIVCPDCRFANTNLINIDGDSIEFFCPQCSKKYVGIYSDFMYWLHHKPLFAARWKALQFQYSISGGDHYTEGDVAVRLVLYKYFFKEKPPKIGMIFSSVLLGDNGQKMSKSRGNYFDVNVDDLIDMEIANDNGGILEIKT